MYQATSRYRRPRIVQGGLWYVTLSPVVRWKLNSVTFYSIPKRDEVTGGSRKLHNEELHNLYSSLSITIMIKSRRMRWAGHVAWMGRRGMHIGYMWENQKERDHYEGQDACGWTILKWILREIGWGGMDWIHLAQDRVRWRVVMNTVMKLRVL
jgi:hypothetical protein